MNYYAVASSRVSIRGKTGTGLVRGAPGGKECGDPGASAVNNRASP